MYPDCTKKSHNSIIKQPDKTWAKYLSKYSPEKIYRWKTGTCKDVKIFNIISYQGNTN